jgi:hypothetical protein
VIRKERRIIPATFADARDLAPRLRDIDRAELHAAVGKPMNPRFTPGLLMDHIRPGTKAIIEDGKVIGLFGCEPGNARHTFGIPWLLGSPELGNDPRWLVRTGNYWVERWLFTYNDCLYNECLASNAASIRWLKALGFQFAVNPTVRPDGTEWVAFAIYGDNHV